MTSILAVEAGISLSRSPAQWSRGGVCPVRQPTCRLFAYRQRSFDRGVQESRRPAQGYGFPRLRGKKFDKSLELIKVAKKLAKQKGYTPARLAINWSVVVIKTALHTDDCSNYGVYDC